MFSVNFDHVTKYRTDFTGLSASATWRVIVFVRLEWFLSSSLVRWICNYQNSKDSISSSSGEESRSTYKNPRTGKLKTFFQFAVSSVWFISDTSLKCYIAGLLLLNRWNSRDFVIRGGFEHDVLIKPNDLLI